jgi:hypothetical protein
VLRGGAYTPCVMGIGEVFVALTMFALFAGIIALVLSYAHKQQEQYARAWHAYASPRGLVFVPRSGPWYNPRAARLVGTVDQIAFEIDTYVVQHNKSSTTYTRVKARAIDPIPSDIRVSTAHLFSGLGRLLGFQDVPTGDAVFDEKYVVKADRDDDARALLDAPTRRALLEFPHSVRFEYRAGEVELHWVGYETHAHVLDAACRIVAAACRWRREPVLYR